MEESIWSFEVKEESPTRRVIVGEVAWSEVKKRLDETLKDLGKQVTLKGFRRGHVPVGLLRRMFGKKVMEELSQQLTREAVAEAVKQKALKVVTGPDDWEITIDSMETDKPLKFTAAVEVLPKIEPKDYEGVELEAEPIEVTDEEVERRLREIRIQFATYEPVEEDMVLRPGRVLECDIMGRVGDEAIDLPGVRVRPEDPEAGLSEISPLPGLVSALEGKDLSSGEVDLSWSVTSSSGEEISYRVLLTVRQLLQIDLPEISDELAKDSGLADTLEELKEVLRKQIAEQKEKEQREALKEQLMKVLRERNPVELPAAAVRAEAGRFRSVLNYIVPEGLENGELIRKVDEAAQEFGERQVHDILLLDAIAQKEGIEVTDEELDAHLENEAKVRNTHPMRLKAELEKKGELEVVRTRLRVEKTYDLLLSKAHVKRKEESAGGEAAPAEEAKSEAEPDEKASEATEEKAEKKPRKRARKTSKQKSEAKAKGSGSAESKPEDSGEATEAKPKKRRKSRAKTKKAEESEQPASEPTDSPE